MHKGVKNLQRKGAKSGGMNLSGEWVGRSGQGLREKEDGVSEVLGVSERQTGSQCGVRRLP